VGLTEATVDGSGTALPRGFEDLEPFATEWGDLSTQNERYRRRRMLSMEQLQAYYDAVRPRLGPIFAHLDSFPFGAPLPEPESRLFRLVMGMTEVAQAVEVLGRPAVPDAPQNYSVEVEVLTRA
jgi:hypothetical protein